MNLRTRLKTFADRADQWIAHAPEWLRPGLGGALIVFLFMKMRGGLIILPIAIVYLAIREPSQLGPMLFLLLLVVPATGFLGGLAYGVVGRFTKPWGRPGHVMQFVAGAWVYCVLLVFIIMPWMEPTNATSIFSVGDWVMASGMGVLFGTVLGVSATGDP